VERNLKGIEIVKSEGVESEDSWSSPAATNY